ncbi:MAG: hypothetical protein AB8F94_00380 [Saprospiraceae bacterium]
MENLTFGPIITLVIVVVTLICVKLAFRKRHLQKRHEFRSRMKPNDTNYNIAAMHGEAIKNATPEEAIEILEKIKEGDLPSLSDEDFYRLKEKIEGKS